MALLNNLKLVIKIDIIVIIIHMETLRKVGHIIIKNKEEKICI